MKKLLIFLLLVSLIAGCKRRHINTSSNARPIREAREYFDKKYLLYRLADHCYDTIRFQQSFPKDKPNLSMPDGIKVDFRPIGYDCAANLQYTHIYSKECLYHTSDSTFKYAEVCFPNTCLTKDKAYAMAHISNLGTEAKTLSLRLFYQNTSYWYATDDSGMNKDSKFLDNYYGASEVQKISVPAHSEIDVKIPYSVGMDPKHEYPYDPSKAPARPGHYEFMLLAADHDSSVLFTNDINLQQVNPFVAVRKDTRLSVEKNTAYVGPHHFKFVFMDEYFDGVNDLTPNHIYRVKDHDEKKLCDTCSGWFKKVISESWTPKDFFKGFIAEAPRVKAEYGIRKKNTRIDQNGITFTIPKSTPESYQKTWGEVNVGPAFKYGHIVVRAKLAPMFGEQKSTNGIIHNIWLYQRDYERPDKNNPYHLLNPDGAQPYEIDFEVWSSQDGLNTMWDDNAFIYYSIVDYMRDTSVRLKPNEKKTFHYYNADRMLPRQVGIPSKELGPEFFSAFHNFELYWYPDRVRYLIDGQEVGLITNDMASIPDKHMYLWLGSPIYQDGTYYVQSDIPFLKADKHTIIDYIKVD